MLLEPGIIFACASSRRLSAPLTIGYKEEGKYYLVLTTIPAENLDDVLLTYRVSASEALGYIYCSFHRGCP